MTWYYVGVNPEPWEVGQLGLGRKNGKVYPRMDRNEQLFSFQESVREWFDQENPPEMITGNVEISFYFWRRLDEWTTPGGRKVTRHIVDATNMQKATEDALQGILYENDKQVKSVSSHIVEEGKDITPGIAIKIEELQFPYGEYIPEFIRKARDLQDAQPKPEETNAWPPGGSL